MLSSDQKSLSDDHLLSLHRPFSLLIPATVLLNLFWNL